MIASVEVNVILLFLVMAVGSSEELYNYSPFSFIKEIIQFLGDSSEGFDVSSLVEKSPSHVEGVPYRTILSDRVAAVDNPNSGNTLHTTQDERQLSLKLVAEPIESAIKIADKKPPSLPKGEALSSLETNFRQDLLNEPSRDLHLIAGPPYLSQQFFMKPKVTPTAATISEDQHSPSLFRALNIPLSDIRSSEIQDKEQFTLRNKDLEKGDSAVSAAVLSQPTRHLDHVLTLQTKDTEYQTTPKITPCNCLSSSAPQTPAENLLGESNNSRFPFGMGDTQDSTSQFSVEQSSADISLPLQSSFREIHTLPDFLNDSPSYNEPSRASAKNTPNVRASENSHSIFPRGEHDHPVLRAWARTKSPVTAQTNTPATSTTALPQTTARITTTDSPSERPGPAENEYSSPTVTQGSSEINTDTTPTSFDNHHGEGRNSFTPTECSRLTVLRSSCDSPPIPVHHLQSEDLLESYVETSQPIFIQNKGRNDMNSNVATNQHAKSLSPPTLPLFAFSPHSNMPYFDPRSQVPEYNGLPYFFGAKGVGPYSCQTCQGVGQLYHLMPMQTIQPM